MSDQRKKYTPAEKAKKALDAIKGELTLDQISSKYGVHLSQFTAFYGHSPFDASIASYYISFDGKK